MHAEELAAKISENERLHSKVCGESECLNVSGLCVYFKAGCF